MEACVNSVGVDLNTASVQLLQYVAGIGAAMAANIVEYRAANGDFSRREEILKVPRLGAKAFQQAAGFLRIPGGTNPLDNTAVHPESYPIVKAMAKDAGVDIDNLVKRPDLVKALDLSRYVTDTVGMPTLNDIVTELENLDATRAHVRKRSRSTKAYRQSTTCCRAWNSPVSSTT